MHQSIGNTNRVNYIIIIMILSLFSFTSMIVAVVSVAGKGTKWCTSLFIYTVVLGSVKWFYI